MRRLVGLTAATMLVACALLGCKRSSGRVGTVSFDALDSGSSDAAVQGEAGLAQDLSPPPEDALPPTSSDELTLRARHLLEAIQKNDPDLAVDIMFPRDGWLSVRDTSDGGKEWDHRVASPFRRTVHRLSHHHDLDLAEFVSIELGKNMVQATPHRRGWRTPLWLVSGSRITFVVGGHTRSLSIRQMTAWRGAWYVTQLR
ncbi:MAG: hypothetical protein ABTD50_07530 [Polyangiaceae bacterium]|jgi:hypothetical protein